MAIGHKLNMIRLFLNSSKAQKIAMWTYWSLLVISALILVFTGINQSWDSWLLRISTAAGILAGFLGRLLPASVVRRLSGSTGGVENDRQRERISNG
jgi:galactitol-specific phosphotransferase system IIC component